MTLHYLISLEVKLNKDHLFGFPLAYSHVECQGTKLEKRDGMTKVKFTTLLKYLYNVIIKRKTK